ncbi:MAG: hypothetical protein ACYSRZ_09790 [Planctomycetota bacterium]|jgi:hypothetical protein
MAIYTVTRPKEDVSDREYGIVTVAGRQYRVFRTSPLFGDLGYGAVKVDGKTYSVYRAKREDGDHGYGVVNIQKKSKKKQAKNDTKKLPEDLAEIARVWSELPVNIKSKIEALAKTHSKE